MTATQIPETAAPETAAPETALPEAVRTALLRDRLVAHLHRLDRAALRDLAEQLGVAEAPDPSAASRQASAPSEEAVAVREAVVREEAPAPADPFPPSERMTMEAYVAELEEGSVAVRQGDFVTLADLRQSLSKYR